jgi:hypothetical protein
MEQTNVVQGKGTVVAQPKTGRLFIEGPGHYYAADGTGPVRVQPGDEVEFEAVYGDQFARVTAIKGRRAS